MQSRIPVPCGRSEPKHAMGYHALDSLLAFPANIPPARAHIVITDTLSADGNFLLHHFLSNHLKAGPGTGNVVLVGIAHIFNHYSIVGRKLGVNLQQSKQSHRLAFIDALTHLNRAPSAPPSPPSLPSTPSAPTTVLTRSATLRPLHDAVSAALVGDRSLLILDDISVLLWSGYGVAEAVGLIRALRVLVQKRNGTLITLLHADEQLASDPVQDAFVRSVLGMAELVLSVQGLGSGFSRDVHGQVNLQRLRIYDCGSADAHSHVMCFSLTPPHSVLQLSIIHGAQSTIHVPSSTAPALPTPQTLHYKILDNTVQFFARGVSEGVL
ncbi:hypothetical protein BC938DRAFT_477360 [Jimgerdemannia flammicorona]|uniref:Elongator complex protein 6 n=1 Tax=Jimgerdemannia flammicorona TaxID=994334 RepID=A0A433QPG9_9FUNG|nr:hypothetical protein BC938DRAFT_477360 [Jimgerdemannia flammicorona]